MWAFLLAPTHLIKHTRGITSQEHLFYHRSLPGPLITHLLEHHTMAPLSFAQQLPRLTPPPHDDLFIPPLPLFEPGGSRSDRSFGLFIRPYVRYHRKDQEHGTDRKARACAQCSRSFLTFSIPRKRSWIQSAPPISLSIPPPPPSHRGLVLAVPDPNTPVVVIAISPRHPHDRNTAGLWHNDRPPLKYDQAHNQDYFHSGCPGLSRKLSPLSYHEL